MQTINQQRAEYALKEVLKITDVKKFKSFSSGAPAVILQNGFGHALAFWYQKGNGKGQGDEHVILTKIIEAWLNNRYPNLFNFTDAKDFLIKITEISQSDYHTVQEEIIKLLEWVKRFANAFIKDPE